MPKNLFFRSSLERFVPEQSGPERIQIRMNKLYESKTLFSIIEWFTLIFQPKDRTLNDFDETWYAYIKNLHLPIILERPNFPR